MIIIKNKIDDNYFKKLMIIILKHQQTRVRHFCSQLHNEKLFENIVWTSHAIKN